MKTNIRTLRSMCIATFTVSLLTACNPEKAEEPKAPIQGTQLESLQVLNNLAEEGILTVTEARQQLKPGDSAIVTGQIGGMEKPFLEGYAGFVMADTDILFCDEMADEDHCPVPWDACCEDPDKLQASRISVQFVDAAGQPITESINGFAGLKGLSYVTVQGTVASGSTTENLIFNATGFYTIGNAE